MGGPSLEVFKFATYVFMPLLVMAHYGNPEWYANNVLPVSSVQTLWRMTTVTCLVWQYKEKIFPPEENLVRVSFVFLSDGICEAFTSQARLDGSWRLTATPPTEPAA